VKLYASCGNQLPDFTNENLKAFVLTDGRAFIIFHSLNKELQESVCLVFYIHIHNNVKIKKCV
jgi:hypothetical protein